MILTREEIKELQGTGSVDIHMDRLPADGPVKVQPAVGLAAVCVVSVEDSWEHRDGGYVVVLKYERRIKVQPRKARNVKEEVRLLKPRHGTTSSIQSAMRDRSVEWDETNADLGPPPEPERIGADLEEEYVKDNRDRFAGGKLSELEAQLARCNSDVERVAMLKDAAHGAGIDVRSEIRALERRLLAKIEKTRKAA